MIRCPGCKYTTQHGHLMELHKENTKHGQEKRAQEWATVSTGKGTFRVKVKHNGPKADQLRKKQAAKRKKQAAKAALSLSGFGRSLT